MLQGSEVALVQYNQEVYFMQISELQEVCTFVLIAQISRESS